MEILQIDVILLKILNEADIEFIYNLLLINKHIKDKIFKYYKEGGIILNDMPLFQECNNISTYLNHYKCYVSGKNFPDNPLWLFNNESDCKYIEINGKYEKIENVRFDKPKFLIYVTSYEFISFKGGLHHWETLNNQQKYLVWCAIKGFHPEIQLDKSLICSDLAVLLSEIYWHYQQSFSRCYLEIYNIDNCDLLNSKCIAKNEIINELRHYKGSHFLEGYNNAFNKEKYINDDLVATGNSRGACIKSIPQSHNKKLDCSNVYSFKNLNLKTDILLKEIIILNNILDEIDEFTITKTNDLKTYNINYLNHMSINYKNPPNNINSCAQQ